MGTFQVKPALPGELTTGWKYCERMEYVTVEGEELPTLGFGTATMNMDEQRERAISAALAAGYRYLDTAQIYGSEPAVGRSVREADVNREQVFITTKLSSDNRAYDTVIDSTRGSLDRPRRNDRRRHLRRSRSRRQYLGNRSLDCFSYRRGDRRVCGLFVRETEQFDRCRRRTNYLHLCLH